MLASPPPLPNIPPPAMPKRTNSTFSNAEMLKKAEWNKRKKLGDGMSHSFGKTPLGNIGVFVHEKAPHERKFDSFAFLLSDEYSVSQIDSADVLSNGLDSISTLVFPGGLVADYESLLGEEGRKKICEYVYNGGGYYGVCAGAFYAGSCNYSNAVEDKKLVGVEIGFHPGLGEAKIQATSKGSEIFGCDMGVIWDVYFSNGCLFRSAYLSSTYLNFSLEAADVLAEYSTLTTNKMSLDFNKPEELRDKYKQLKEQEQEHQKISSPLFAHAQHPQIEEFSSPPAACVSGSYGLGRVLCFGPHPEGSGEDLSFVIRNCFLWLSRLPPRPQPEK